MSNSFVKVRTDACSGTIVINRPDRRNALSRPVIAAIVQALEDLHQERKVRGVILTGSGSCFSAGMDLHEIHETSQQETAAQQWHDDAIAYRDLLLAMLRFPKPIIAAVNGATHGGGTGLILASDIVVAGKSAIFSVPAIQRGLVAGLVAPLLVFRIAAGRAARLMLTGEPIDAAEGLRQGIFHEVVADDFVWARAQEIATGLSQAASEAVAMTKRLINETIGESLCSQLTLGAAATATAKTTDAAAEGIAAFVEKRPPKWDP